MQSKQYFTKIKNYPHEKSTEPTIPLPTSFKPMSKNRLENIVETEAQLISI